MITKPLEKEHCVTYLDTLQIMLQKGKIIEIIFSCNK